MDLEFSDEQLDLHMAVREVLDSHCPMSLVRAFAEGRGDASALWQCMVDLGWPALTIAEEYGGLGMSFVDAALVIEELGAHVTPGPFLATVTQFVPVVRELGSPSQRAELLEGVANGMVTGALALGGEGNGAPDLSRLTTTATRVGAHYQIKGTNQYALDALSASAIAIVARVEGAPGVLVVDRHEVDIQSLATVDATMQLCSVEVDGVKIAADRLLAGPPNAEVALVGALEEATVATALVTVGVCQTILDVAIEYAKVRKQFGVPIGSFQAVKHKLANMFVALAKARSLAYVASAAISEGDSRRSISASAAKAAAGDCQQLIAQDGLQLMGAIGYTWEHDMHLLLRRAKSLEPLMGTAAWHRANVARLLDI